MYMWNYYFPLTVVQLWSMLCSWHAAQSTEAPPPLTQSSHIHSTWIIAECVLCPNGSKLWTKCTSFVPPAIRPPSLKSVGWTVTHNIAHVDISDSDLSEDVSGERRSGLFPVILTAQCWDADREPPTITEISTCLMALGITNVEQKGLILSVQTCSDKSARDSSALINSVNGDRALACE